MRLPLAAFLLLAGCAHEVPPRSQTVRDARIAEENAERRQGAEAHARHQAPPPRPARNAVYDPSKGFYAKDEADRAQRDAEAVELARATCEDPSVERMRHECTQTKRSGAGRALTQYQTVDRRTGEVILAEEPQAPSWHSEWACTDANLAAWVAKRLPYVERRCGAVQPLPHVTPFLARGE